MVREENGFSCLTLLPACICSWASLYLGRMDGVPMAGQDGGSLQSCADAQEQVAGHQGMPWATEGFPLPVHPGLMSRQVLLQMQSYSWLKTGHTMEGCSGTEHCGTGGKPCRCHSSLALPPFKLCFFLATFLGEQIPNGLVLVLDVAGQGPGRRQECLTQQSQQAAFPQQLQQ